MTQLNPMTDIPTDEMIDAGIAAWDRMNGAMVLRNVSETPEDLPDYDEGDVCAAIYTAMRSSAPQEPDNDALIESVIRDLAAMLFHHAVTKFDPQAAERCIQKAIDRLQAKAPEID